MSSPAHTVGDSLAIISGVTGLTLTQASEIAGLVSPILSVMFLLMSLGWLGWRMVDRYRFGPIHRRRDGED